MAPCDTSNLVIESHVSGVTHSQEVRGDIRLDDDSIDRPMKIRRMNESDAFSLTHDVDASRRPIEDWRYTT